jgi:hypothetical protein
VRAELPSPEEVTRAALQELSQPKYRQGEPWWTRLIAWLERMWTRFVEWLLEASEAVGGPAVLALIVGVVVIAAAILITANLGRRRARSVEARLRTEFERSRGLDPAELEARASEAEGAGDLATAFRLLFRAALVRLDRAGLIDLQPGTTSGSLVETLGSDRFAAIAARFDAVVYGDRPAEPSDLTSVREVVPELLGARR